MAPLYTFARRRGNNSADAQDLVQGFFAYLLQSKAYAQTDRKRGKFRSFLLASFKNYMTDAWDKTRAIKRGGEHEFVLLNDEVEAAEALSRRVPPAMKLDDEQQYEQAWAAALAARALMRYTNTNCDTYTYRDAQCNTEAYSNTEISTDATAACHPTTKALATKP